MEHGGENGVHFFGTHDNGMVLIEPAPFDEHEGMVDLLSELGELFVNIPSSLLQKFIDQGDKSFRFIQAGRYEFSIKDPVNGTCAFDCVLMRAPPRLRHIKPKLISYAKMMAWRDPRIARSRSFEFKEQFTIIIGKNNLPEQVPHVDVLTKQSHQFVLMLTRSKGTKYYRVKEDQQGFCTVADLIGLWRGQIESTGARQLSDALLCEMQREEEIHELMKNCGNVLAPRSSLDTYEPNLEGDTTLECGSLCSVPGSELHGAPPSIEKEPRAVLFYVAEETQSEGETEHFFGPILIGAIISKLWTKSQIRYSERLFLLRMLLRQIELHCSTYPDISIWPHLLGESYTKLVHNLESNTKGTSKRKRGNSSNDHLLEEATKDDKLFE